VDTNVLATALERTRTASAGEPTVEGVNLDEMSDYLARTEVVEGAIGFRNILAHRHGDIDHEVVSDVLHNDLRWFEQFQQEIARWFQQIQT
jgi:uncharacterized protein YutE (UPF0331/DUF86 family)